MILVIFRTIKRLKWIQIFNRFIRKIPRIRSSLKNHSFLLQEIVTPFPLNEITYTNNKFIFIGIEGSIDDLQKLPLLWQYNFFYCDFLLSKSISDDEKRYLISRISSILKLSPVGREPYPASLRIINMIKWLNIIGDDALSTQIKNIIKLDYESLVNKIEYHLLGNHILANFKALIFHDIFFFHPKKNSNLDRWMKSYEQQLEEQILNDGGHFELSHMYHNIIIEDIIDILNIINGKGFRAFEERLSSILVRMIHWANYLTNAVGNLFYTNDCVDGVSKQTNDLKNYAKKILKDSNNNLVLGDGTNLITLTDSGFSSVRTNSFFLCINHADVKASYIPGHFHADTLSFEISNNQSKILCNPGLSTYAVSDERMFERGTLSHNCLSINNKNSSEVWKSFRLGRSAEITSFSSTQKNNRTTISASHNGYKNIQHTRSWVVENNSIIIYDEIYSSNSFKVLINFLVHPNFKILAYEEKELTIGFESKIYRLSSKANHEFNLILKPAYYCSSFGVKHNTSSILLSIEKKDKIDLLKAQFIIEEI